MEYMLPDVGSTDLEAYYETAEAEFLALQDLSTDGWKGEGTDDGPGAASDPTDLPEPGTEGVDFP